MHGSRWLVGVVIASAASACTFATREPVYESSAYADGTPVTFAGEPTLVAVEPDVWVAEDVDQPLYYADGSYWTVRGGAWYQSPSYDRGWRRIDLNGVPPKITAHDPMRYVHFHGSANAPKRRATLVTRPMAPVAPQTTPPSTVAGPPATNPPPQIVRPMQPPTAIGGGPPPSGRPEVRRPEAPLELPHGQAAPAPQPPPAPPKKHEQHGHRSR